MNNEIKIKENRLRNFMELHNLDGLLLSTREFFSWITGGKLNHILISTELGVVDLLITKNKKYCIASKFERYRIMEEELNGLGYEVLEFNWWESSNEEMARNVTGGGKLGCDTHSPIGINVYEELKELRYSLLPEEIERYKAISFDAATALENTCKNIRRGMSEYEISGELQKNETSKGVEPMAALVISDERLFKYRHPVPTDKKIEKYVLVVICGRKYGLIACASRFVHFDPPPREIVTKHRKVIKIDTEYMTNTIAGRKVSDVFKVGIKAYAEAGYENEWQLLHQGGPLGYSVRDYFATPNIEGIVQLHQAFAWNPSITGTKSEDTILVKEDGFEILTQTNSWPLIEVEADNGKRVARPDILVL